MKLLSKFNYFRLNGPLRIKERKKYENQTFQMKLKINFNGSGNNDIKMTVNSKTETVAD